MDTYHPTHYSHSSASQAKNCARQYYYRKILKIPEGSKPALVIGHIADEVCNEILRSIRDAAPLPNPDEFANTVLERELAINADIDLEHKHEIIEFFERTTHELAFQQYKGFVDFAPTHIQQEGRLWIKGIDVPVLLFTDVVGERAGKPLIVDNKTAGRKPSAKQYAEQLAVYALWHLKKHGQLPECEVLALVKTKHPYWMRLQVEITSADLMSAISLIRSHHALHMRGEFHPNRQSVFCSEKNCSYWERCHADHDFSLDEIGKNLTYAE